MRTEKFPTLDFANSDELQVGDVVLAIGNPFGVGQTVTHGIISALARTQVGITDYQFFIQTDAAINPGNSGGALVDMTGRLAGINTAIFSRSGGSQGIGFAIPANMVRVVVASAKSGGKAVKRPWLGARLQAVTPEIAETLGLQLPTGALVANVVAEQSGGARRPEAVRPDRGDRRADGRRSQRLRLSLRDASARRHRRRSMCSAAARRSGSTCRWRPRPIPAATKSSMTARSPFQGAKVANISPAVADELHLDADDRRRRRHRSGRWRDGRQCRLPEGRHHPRGQQPEDRQDQPTSKRRRANRRGSGASRWCVAASRFNVTLGG